jgi:hypothetical protein
LALIPRITNDYNCVLEIEPADHRRQRQTRSGVALASGFALAGKRTMNKDNLQRSIDSYLAIREALGFKMHTTRILLTDFVEYLSTHNIFNWMRF